MPSQPVTNYERRHERWAAYRVVNAVLIVATLLLSAIAGLAIYALYQNSQALANFRPLIYRENDMGQTYLDNTANLNFGIDEKGIRSALWWWAGREYDHQHATARQYREQAQFWMAREHADAIKQADEQNHYIKSVLDDTDEYRVDVSNVVLTSETKDATGAISGGTAQVFATRCHVDAYGGDLPHKPGDDFIIAVNWAVAAEVPPNLQGLNPFGVAVTHEQIINALK